MLILNEWEIDFPMSFELATYAHNGNLFVGLISHKEGYPEPWCDLTVCFDIECKSNCAFIDVNNNGNKIIDWLVANKLGQLTGDMELSDWCVYPEFEFNMDELMKHVTEDNRERK